MNIKSNFYFVIVLFFLFFGILFLFSTSLKESLDTLSNDYNLDIPEQPLFLTIKNDLLNTDLPKDFCKFNQSSLESSCNKLTSSNCLVTDCCVLINGKKCVAGSDKGPTYLTNTDGTKINVDYYYYQQKCFGSNCPK